MKTDTLKKNIIINSSILSVLILIFSSCIFFIYYQKKNADEESNKINTETETIKNKTASIAGKASLAKKYKDLYSQIPLEKRTNLTGIKMDEINFKLKTIGDKFYITNREIKINVPENFKDEPFKLKTMNVLYTSVVLNFRSYTEDKAFLFLDEFLKSLNGYTILINIDIRKEKEYSSENLINISAGKGIGNVSTKAEFYWYSFKEDDKAKVGVSKIRSSQIKTENVIKQQ
ncbi:hypothetical protein LBMAG18_09170 [Alphaproteobacteria bacterium]|nr:hypothetical protein LBMAG18_09170 [Alphaproteobacteria bacterium]